MPVVSIEKFVSNVFFEMAKNDMAYKIPLHTHFYDAVLQKYGLKVVAEKKFEQILRAVFAYRNSSNRLMNVAKYTGLTHSYDEMSY